MVTNIQYTSIKRVLDNLLDHPMMQGTTLEQAVRYALRFISLFGFPSFYEDKVAEVEISDFRGVLPCDLISVVQVMDSKHHKALRSMTGTFNPSLADSGRKECTPVRKKCPDLHNNAAPEGMDRTCCERKVFHEASFKTQGRVIYTSFPEGRVRIAYKAIPVDDDGFPLLIDNEVYLNALELYIKKAVFTVKFDMGKLTAGVLQNVQQEYAWAAGELQNEMTVPSISEMESLTRLFNTMILPVRHFDNGFRDLGNREYLRKH